jgi:hypothetical protein
MNLFLNDFKLVPPLINGSVSRTQPLGDARHLEGLGGSHHDPDSVASTFTTLLLHGVRFPCPSSGFSTLRTGGTTQKMFQGCEN